MEPNFADVRMTIGRGVLGPTVNLFSLSRPVELTEDDYGLTAEPHKIKPRQFGKLELEVRYLVDSQLPEGGVDVVLGTKTRASRRSGISKFYAVGAVFVNSKFRGEGYGLAMYLKALDFVSSKGLWMCNDTKRSTSESASGTWRALFRYANKTLEGPPPPQRLFDYAKQDWAMGYSSRENNKDVVVPDHRPMYAAYGLNGRGQQILSAL